MQYRTEVVDGIVRAIPNTQDACKRGHLFTIDNTWLRGTQRVCRACCAIRQRAYRQRKATQS